jgi:predicted TIM-barrel fold metal-dependent hydrolase
VARKNALILLHQGKVMDSNSHQIEPLISDGFHIAVLAKQVPTAKIICGHIFGGGDWEWTAKALKDIPSVYIDTSGSVIDDGAIEFIAGQIGTERLLFATDLSIEEGVGKILGCNLSKNVKKAVFSENFHNLLTKIKK